MKMKCLLLFLLMGSVVQSAEVVLPYSAFGSQVMAYELIGMEWWQWEHHGDSRPRAYPVKVVVYWGQALEETKRRFPVDRKKEHDYRYVEYSAAVRYLEKMVTELKEANLDPAPLERTLAELRSARAKLPATTNK